MINKKQLYTYGLLLAQAGARSTYRRFVVDVEDDTIHMTVYSEVSGKEYGAILKEVQTHYIIKQDGTFAIIKK
ncbi:MAG: hypothetical protein GF411_02965 [Candidatus Lokiarchaeota archaeon]|nr:hypothetical protein [Candidatus Lokiarchaeota archaeon]